MLLDILNSDNYINFNIRAAQIFGLNAAVYCSELLNIFKKASKKNKLIDDNYFKIDRKYIFERTTLSIEEQLIIDANLLKVNILSKHKDNPDIISFDAQLFASIITDDNAKLIENISKKVKINAPKGVKESARQRIIAELKDSIVCSNYELLTALRNWVDSIYSNPKGGYLSKTAVKVFQDTLNNYTQGDLDLALRIVQIADIQGYRDCNWAIAVHEKDKKIQRQAQIANNNLPRVTQQERATINTLSDEIF